MATDVKIIIPNATELARMQREHDKAAARQAAKSFSFDGSAIMLRFVLRSGVQVSIPVKDVPILRKATRAQLETLELYPTGLMISLPELDIDLSVSEILRDALGFELQQRRAGRARSHAKAKASRANGKKGGRPRKAAA